MPDQVALNLRPVGVLEEPGGLHGRGETAGSPRSGVEDSLWAGERASARAPTMREQHDHTCRGKDTIQWVAALESHEKQG